MSPLVYLFEDDESLRELLIEVLREEVGAAVEVCASIVAVHEQCAVRRPDLIVADFWGTSHLRLADSERSEIKAVAALAPTVLVSARNWALDVETADLGLAGLMSKPLDLERLVTMLRATLVPPAAAAGTAEEIVELPPHEALSVFVLQWP